VKILKEQFGGCPVVAWEGNERTICQPPSHFLAKVVRGMIWQPLGCLSMMVAKG